LEILRDIFEAETGKIGRGPENLSRAPLAEVNSPVHYKLFLLQPERRLPTYRQKKESPDCLLGIGLSGGVV
jgi:hypothetical protein